MHGLSGEDDYGLPVNILGVHPEEFYGLIGRIICVCAVLEDKVTTLRHTLERAPQGQFTHQPVSDQIERARALADRPGAPHATQVQEFCDEVKQAFDHRNELVHSSFPAQADGTIWGHRPHRGRSVTDGRAQTVKLTLEELYAFLDEVVRLVKNFNHIHALAGTITPVH